jgi:hypothetical protein
MKIRNKKTGEIATLTLSSNGEELLLMKNNEMVTRNVKLSDLEEWEDAPEEPKEYWYINCYYGEVLHTFYNGSEWDERRKLIGNYFLSREEAELAVRKLKAWKRLKDKGFKFGRWQFLDDRSGIWVQGNLVPDIVDELDILFGGEE